MILEQKPSDLGLCWGVKPIARKLNLTERQAYHLLETGKIPAQKIGAKWVASEDGLREFFAKALRGGVA